MCVCAPCVNLAPVKITRAGQIPGVTGNCELPCWWWELNLGLITGTQCRKIELTPLGCPLISSSALWICGFVQHVCKG